MDSKKLDIKPLVFERPSAANVTFPISDKELCDRYSRVSTPMINDVLRRMGILYQTLPTSILPLREGMRV